MMNSLAKFALLAGCFTFVGTTLALAQEQPSHEHSMHEHEPRLAQIVALDECDPTTFNAALGPDFLQKRCARRARVRHEPVRFI